MCWTNAFDVSQCRRIVFPLLYFLRRVLFDIPAKGIFSRGHLGKDQGSQHLPWVIITIVVSLLANYLIARSIQLSNATLAALVEISYPLFTILFSFLLLNTVTLNLHVAIGGTLIMAGVIYVSLFAH